MNVDPNDDSFDILNRDELCSFDDETWFKSLGTTIPELSAEDDLQMLLTDVMTEDDPLKQLKVTTNNTLEDDDSFSPPILDSKVERNSVNDVRARRHELLSQSPHSTDSGLPASDQSSECPVEPQERPVVTNRVATRRFHCIIPQTVYTRVQCPRKSDPNRSARGYLKDAYKQEQFANPTYNYRRTDSLSLKRSYPLTPPGSHSSASDNEIQTPNSKKYANNSRSQYINDYDSQDDDDSQSSYSRSGGYGYSSGSRSNSLFQNPIPSSGVLSLTEEEKRTLLSEGYAVPTRLPLSKQEERNLKKIRRKIKNKISAQESRRKKKEYLETLEKRVDNYSQENLELKRRVDGLESTNRSLLSQLRHLQQLMMKNNSGGNGGGVHAKASGHAGRGQGGASMRRSVTASAATGVTTGTAIEATPGTDTTGGSASTCLMMFVLCFAVLLAGQPVENKAALDLSASPDAASSGMLGSLSSWNQLGYAWEPGAKPTALSKDRKAQEFGASFDQAMEKVMAEKRALAMEEEAQSPQAPVKRVTILKTDVAKKDFLRALPSSQPFANQAATQMRKYTPQEQLPKSTSRILGGLQELEQEYDETCEPPTIWSYLFGDSATNEENSRSAVERKRKIIKIYTQDEMLFQRHHVNETEPVPDQAGPGRVVIRASPVSSLLSTQ